jgi:hypothetical protein
MKHTLRHERGVNDTHAWHISGTALALYWNGVGSRLRLLNVSSGDLTSIDDDDLSGPFSTAGEARAAAERFMAAVETDYPDREGG